jgi:hypothetical protein
MKAAQCAAVPQIIDTVNKEYKDCTNKADSWFNTRTTYCDGLSSNTSTNNLSGNVKVVSGSTTNTTNSGMTPAECTTQANVTYKTKTDLCTSDKAAGLGAAKTMSDNNCPK